MAHAAVPALEQYARARIGDFAEDAVSESILRAFSHLDRFDGHTGAAGARKWLLGILNLVIMEELRRREKERQGCELLAELAMTDEGEELARRAMLEDAADRLREAENDLPPLQWECLAAWIEGEHAGQTGKRLGISVKSVYYHRHQAMKRCWAEWPFAAANLDSSRWRSRNWIGGFSVTIYHAPQRTGAGLAREMLRKMK